MSSAPEQPSLYRRHRPRTFEEVVGQEGVVRTLRNAVERGRVHHAYLFVGSRGTGKTSMAKILAACLNCERAPTVQPCGVCEACRGIAAGSSLDVIEMDAASNNSVDDIRELRESVAYAPVSGGTKVYILDEAHMLSTAAWNAFLKTLEEPPPNTVFVLATTEAQKVPATVVDRCHRFDFGRPTAEQLASVVRRVAESEGIEIGEEAMAAVSRAAEGSFRDALGTLEQLVTYSGTEIALEDVLAVLGVADSELLEGTLEAVASGDAGEALRAVAQCCESGRDPGAFAGDLERRARELMVVRILGEVPQELSLTAEADARLAEQAQRIEEAVLVRALDLLASAMEAIKAGADARTQLELALVKAARPEVEVSTSALLARIERLERAEGEDLKQPAAGAAGGVAFVAPPRRHGESAGAERAGTARGQRGSGSSESSSPPRPADEPQAPDEEALAADTADGPPPPPRAAAEPARSGGPGRDDGTAAGNGPAQPGTPARNGGPAREDGTDVESWRALWPAVVDVVRGENALLGALIAEARPVEMSGDELRVAFASTAPFLKKKAEARANRAAVASALERVAGRRVGLAYELREELDAVTRDGEGAQSEEEWVARVMAEFDAEELPGDWVAGERRGGEERAR